MLPRLLIVLALLAGCAAPRYQTTTRYEPPPGGEGQACVTTCEASLNACRSDCRTAWQACSARIEPDVEPRYNEALRDWGAQLRRYRQELDRYEWELWVNRNSYFGNPWYQPWPHPWPLGYGYALRPPPPGAEPSREAIRTALLKQHCNDDCGCQGKYDGCYQACGGRLTAEVQCVANCR